MARRGFLAELQHQAKVAAREQARAEREAERRYKARVREAEQARKAAERAAQKWARAREADRKQAEKEAREAHLASMTAEVEQRNAALAGVYDEIDTLLEATLDADDFVDLESLRAVVRHPRFDRPDLQRSIPPPPPILDPEAPVWVAPSPPTGLGALFGKKRHAKALEEAKADYDNLMSAWNVALEETAGARRAAEEQHTKAEARRREDLAAERARFATECQAREAEAAEHNRQLDVLIANLGYGVADAIQEYVGIVLSNSVYPDHFPVDHEFTFDPQTAELSLRAIIPGPDALPTIKGYKYTRSSDEISELKQTQKACNDRYASAVHQVALRSLHEVFEADRRGLIQTISLVVGAQTLHPATGRDTFIPLAAVAVERKPFLHLDLRNVVPEATLAHFGGVVSKSPFKLIPVDPAGVRS